MLDVMLIIIGSLVFIPIVLCSTAVAHDLVTDIIDYIY